MATATSNQPSLDELNSLTSGAPEFTTDCSHWTAEFWDDYPATVECRLRFCHGETWDDDDLKQIEERGGGYVCLVHDFPRSATIAERLGE